MTQKQSRLASRGRRISVSVVRQWLIFRPLTVLLAILMLPAIPSKRSSGFKAEAQTLGSCEPVGGNRIIRKYCGAGGSPVFQLDKFESDAILTYLALHGLPETDANVIHTYGRRDVRNAVRAIMVSRLASIVKKAPSQRTADEQALYNWFEGIVQRNEIEYFSQSLAHFTSFNNDPCRFRLDSGIAKVLGITYDGGPFCTLLGRIYPPPVPSSDYFRMYGMSKSYGKFADNFSNATAVAADTQLNMQMVAGISGAVVALVTGAVYAGFTAVAYAAAVAAVTVVTTTKIAGDLWAISTVVGTVSGYGFLLPALGPAAIVIVAATMIVTVGIQTFDNQRQLDNLANLRTGLERAQTTKPDLKAMLDDTSGLGFNKFSLSLVGETLPEVESTTVLPQRRPSIDPIFRVADTRGIAMTFNELTYRDWNETIWSASTWGGWFVQRCLNDKGVSTCALRDSITASIRYLDWKGAKWTASRLGNRFTHTKLGPVASGDAPCPPDPTTGVSPGPDFSKCSTYVSDSINLLDGNGNGLQSTVTLVPYEAPRFTGSTVLSFSPGLAASYQIVAEGNPTPTICATVVTTPALISVPSCGPSPFTISYNGTGSPAIGNFPIRLTAANAVRTVTQDYIINVGTDVKIITPAILNTSYKQPVNFTIVAAGSPKPRFTLDPGVNLEGLSFRDNLDGTATISGTAGNATFFGPCEEIVGQTCPRIRASNGVTSDSQIFTVQVAGPPNPSHVGPFTLTAAAGVSNTFKLLASGATTPLTWSRSGNTPSWIQLVSGSDGVGRVTVSPPAGTTGSFPVSIGVSAAGTSITFNQTYTFDIVNAPLFTGPNVLNFIVGNPGAVVPRVENVTASTGTVSLNSILPPGITGQPDPGNSRYSLTAQPGSPPPGSGGQYPLQFTATSPDGTAEQEVTVQIFEAPRFTGAPLAVLFAGRPAELLQTATGYPSTGTVPGLPPAAPATPIQGWGMYFTTQGLPPSLQASNLNEFGYPSGTLRISGTPANTEAGTYRVQVTAANGVGNPVQRTVTLIVYPYAPTTSVQMLTTSSITRDPSGNIVATVVVANAGRDAAQNVALSSVRLNGVAGIIAPASVESVAAASTATFTVQFPASAASAGVAVLSVAGSHSGGNFSSGARVAVP